MPAHRGFLQPLDFTLPSHHLHCMPVEPASSHSVCNTRNPPPPCDLCCACMQAAGLPPVSPAHPGWAQPPPPPPPPQRPSQQGSQGPMVRRSPASPAAARASPMHYHSSGGGSQQQQQQAGTSPSSQQAAHTSAALSDLLDTLVKSGAQASRAAEDAAVKRQTTFSPAFLKVVCTPACMQVDAVVAVVVRGRGVVVCRLCCTVQVLLDGNASASHTQVRWSGLTAAAVSSSNSTSGQHRPPAHTGRRVRLCQLCKASRACFVHRMLTVYACHASCLIACAHDILCAVVEELCCMLAARNSKGCLCPVSYAYRVVPAAIAGLAYRIYAATASGFLCSSAWEACRPVAKVAMLVRWQAGPGEQCAGVACCYWDKRGPIR